MDKNSIKNEDQVLVDTSKSNISEFAIYLKKRLLSPYFIVGISILIFIITISVNPQTFTPYSYAELNGVFPGSWEPPSPQHPLGTIKFGRDLLGRILYGIQNSFYTASLGVLIALVGGLLIGIPMSFINQKLTISSERMLILFYIYTLVIFPVLIIASIPSYNIFIIGILLIPIFAQIFAKTEFNLTEFTKKILIYAPLIFGFIILLYSFIGFLGFSDPTTINLGYEIQLSRVHVYDAPWGVIFPGIAVFIMIIGPFLLYASLQKNPSTK
ncbi:MAG: hypothetical protein GF316_19180 [Candidatus Lokiarchaeota archaeon]|nr:hypothetical protein [Candidatus Lokiarchaeota archaeon]